MKSSLVYKLWVQVPTPFICDHHGYRHSTISLSAENITPMWYNSYFTPSPYLPEPGFSDPSGVVGCSQHTGCSLRTGNLPTVVFRGGNFGFRPSSCSTGFPDNPLGPESGSYADWVSTIAEQIAAVHRLLHNWACNDPRIAIGNDAMLLPQVLRGPTAFLAASSQFPNYEEDSEDRPLSPHFELDACTRASMQGLCNNLFWV